MFHACAIPAGQVPEALADAGPRTCPTGIDREVAYLQTFSGADLLVLAQTGPAAGTVSSLGETPLPRATRAWTSVPDDLEADDIYVSAVPLRPGMCSRFTAFAEQLDGPRKPDLMLEMVRARHGEVVFIQQGETDLVIPIVIGREPWSDGHRAAPGESAFNTWANDQLAELHGIRFADAPPPANKHLWDIRSTDGRG
ncbi:hypothetical protein [Streptomyces sp. NPDC047061]|uniref:hypothetical protein n=1 Tax=Streptomyces sp. NPDC047061 TaxID=3154605 RepID=UPI0033E9DC9C